MTLKARERTLLYFLYALLLIQQKRFIEYMKVIFVTMIVEVVAGCVIV